MQSRLKNSKPRTVPARMSAKRRAQFEAEGKVPFSTIRVKQVSCGAMKSHGEQIRASQTGKGQYLTSNGGKIQSAKSCNKSRNLALPAGKIKSRKRSPPRKKRTGTPIRSKPFENRLDLRSHWTASGNLKLYGKDKEAMRERIFVRAGGRCEETVTVQRNVSWNKWHPYFVPVQVRCPNPATEWSHDQHGAKKSDAFDAGIASCAACHRRKHGQY